MSLLVLIALIAILTCIAYQDIKSREVSLFLYIGLFIFNIIYVNNLITVGENLLYNILYLVIIFSILLLYFRLVHQIKKLSEFIDVYIGIGDLVYLIAITPLFTIYYYIMYFIVSLIMSLIVFKLFRIKKNIPLAGYMSIQLVLIISITFFLNYDISINNFNL